MTLFTSFSAIFLLMTLHLMRIEGTTITLKDGIATAEYMITKDETIIMKLQIEAKGWVGIGWHAAESKEEGMSQADYVIGSFTNGTLKVGDYYSNQSKNGGFTRPVLDTDIGGKDDIIWFDGQQTDKRTTIWFERKLVTEDTVADHPILDKFTTVIWARGNPSEADPNVLKYHGENPDTRGLGPAVNFLSGSTKASDHDTLVYWHASMMVIAFAFCMTFGMFVSRYLKQYYWWFPVHIVLQIVGTLLALVAFILALVMVSGKHFTTVHSWFGISTLILAFLSPILGFTSHFKYDPNRSSIPFWPDKLHWWIGRGAIVLSWVTIILGMVLFGAPKAIIICFSLAIGFFAFLFVFIDSYKRYFSLDTVNEKHTLLGNAQ